MNFIKILCASLCVLLMAGNISAQEEAASLQSLNDHDISLIVNSMVVLDVLSNNSVDLSGWEPRVTNTQEGIMAEVGEDKTITIYAAKAGDYVLNYTLKTCCTDRTITCKDEVVQVEIPCPNGNPEEICYGSKIEEVCDKSACYPDGKLICDDTELCEQGVAFCEQGQIFIKVTSAQ